MLQPQSCIARQYRDQSQIGASLPCEARSVGSDILIAWDASAEIVSTLEAFLPHAGEAETITFAPLSRASIPSARDAAAWLADRGIAARLPPGARRAGGKGAIRRLLRNPAATLPVEIARLPLGFVRAAEAMASHPT